MFAKYRNSWVKLKKQGNDFNEYLKKITARDSAIQDLVEKFGFLEQKLVGHLLKHTTGHEIDNFVRGRA